MNNSSEQLIDISPLTDLCEGQPIVIQRNIQNGLEKTDFSRSKELGRNMGGGSGDLLSREAVKFLFRERIIAIDREKISRSFLKPKFDRFLQSNSLTMEDVGLQEPTEPSSTPLPP